MCASVYTPNVCKLVHFISQFPTYTQAVSKLAQHVCAQWSFQLPTAADLASLSL